MLSTEGFSVILFAFQNILSSCSWHSFHLLLCTHLVLILFREPSLQAPAVRTTLSLPRSSSLCQLQGPLHSWLPELIITPDPDNGSCPFILQAHLTDQYWGRILAGMICFLLRIFKTLFPLLQMGVLLLRSQCLSDPNHPFIFLSLSQLFSSDVHKLHGIPTLEADFILHGGPFPFRDTSTSVLGNKSVLPCEIILTSIYQILSCLA